MSKEIWLGPLLGSNRAKLIERCAELVAEGKSDQFLYLAASHPLLELVTEGILDGHTNRGVWGELPVYLFRGFVRRIISTAVDEAGTPLAPRMAIDREEFPLKRSLVSRILARLIQTGQLKAIAPLGNREGCVNTITTLIGEIERAAKTPAEVAEIIAARTQDQAKPAGDEARDQAQTTTAARGPHTQVDFDQEVALIYATYSELLDRHQLTEADADSLRALAILKGDPAGVTVQVPWLRDVQLLVLDGFFDFTPVQGEILRQLIPAIPEVLVNLNHDERNPEIFLPFQDTIDHLSGIANFEKKWIKENITATRGALSGLRESLFNSSLSTSSAKRQLAADVSADPISLPQSEIRYFECGDRDTEIRAVAKEIKRLVLREGYSLAEVALVVRQKASYAETLARVMREESLPCNLESHLDATDIPSLRAALKLFAILEESARDENSPTRVSALADLIKSEYFRPGKQELEALSARFDTEYAALLHEGSEPLSRSEDAQRELTKQKRRYRIGVWDADALENAFAYVGSELPVSAWLDRARQLIKELPGARSTRELLGINTGGTGETGDTGDAGERDPDEADQIENAETAKVESADVEKKRRPSRDIHPAALAWTSLVIQAFASRIEAVPREGKPADLRLALMTLLDQFSFREQIARPVSSSLGERELPRALLNFNSLEALRRAFVAAIKSIELLSEPPALAGGRVLSEPPALAGGAKTGGPTR